MIVMPLQENDYLKLKVYHNDGKYKLSVTKITIDGVFESFTPFALGNFNYVISTGRKSAKKLQTYELILDQLSEELKTLWVAGKYQEMIQLFSSRIGG